MRSPKHSKPTSTAACSTRLLPQLHLHQQRQQQHRQQRQTLNELQCQWLCLLRYRLRIHTRARNRCRARRCQRRQGWVPARGQLSSALRFRRRPQRPQQQQLQRLSSAHGRCREAMNWRQTRTRSRCLAQARSVVRARGFVSNLSDCALCRSCSCKIYFFHQFFK